MAILDGIFNQQGPGLLGRMGIDGPTLMALGAGLASGDSWGEGIGQGLALASGVKQNQQARAEKLAPMKMSYDALVSAGLSPQEALLEVYSPGTSKRLEERRRNAEWQKAFLSGGQAAGTASQPASQQPGGGTAGLPTVAGVHERFGVTDPLVGAVIDQESAWNPKAVSPKGATGLMQLMPATARDPGFGVAPFAEGKPLTDPAENVRLGTDYLKAMRERYSGDIPAMLVAYNAGPGVADKWIAGGRDMGALPRETRDYVQAISARLDAPMRQAGRPIGETSASGRPVYQDAQGQPYSERTKTFPIGNRWYTFPSVDAQGREMTEKQVADYVRDKGPVDPITGEQFPSFASRQEAEAYAQQRSGTRLPAQPMQLAQPRPAQPQTVNSLIAGLSPQQRTLLARMGPETGMKLLAERVFQQADTTDIRNYNLAKQQGYQGSIVDWITQVKKAGAPTVNVGNDALGLTKPMQNTVQEKQFNATEHLSRLNDIKGKFRPEFQTLPVRAGMTWTSLKAKMGRDLNPAERANLSEFTQYRRTSINNVNRLLNELSGAAVSPQEAVRLRASQPDAGDGIFDGDDPVTFQSKLDDTIRDQMRAIARMNYVQRQGLSGKPWEVMGLQEIDQVINERGNQILAGLQRQNPNANPQDIMAEVRARLVSEFGISMGAPQ